MGLWEGDVNQEDLPGILSPANEGPECSSTPRKVPCDTPGGFCWLLNDMTMLLMTPPSPERVNLSTYQLLCDTLSCVFHCFPLGSVPTHYSFLFVFIKMGTSDKHSYARLGGPSLAYLSIDSFFWTLKHMSWIDVLRFIELFTCWWAFMLHSTTTALVHLSMYFFKTKSRSRHVSWKGKCQWPRHRWTSRALLPHALTLPLWPPPAAALSLVLWNLRRGLLVSENLLCVRLWAFRILCAFNPVKPKQLLPPFTLQLYGL